MTIDVVALAALCGVTPLRTSDPAAVPALVDAHGAALLTGAGTTEADASALARRTYGERLVAAARPIPVTDGGGRDRRLDEDAARRMLPLHTDGFAYGASAPDLFFLLCTTASANDGRSFLVDQVALLDALATAAAPGSELAHFVRTHVVDQTEPGAQPALGPIALPLPSGRAAVRRSITVRPSDDDPDPARTSRLLTLWQGLLDTIGALVPRFGLQAGDAIAIDNTRLAHGRDAYTSDDRLLWRCWAWTDRAGGVPDGELWSDTRMLLGDSPGYLRR
jgi:alpha-ketoglutarate-dependent taurine dioxygenase